MRLGILGGTFNPIHNGHLAMAEAARTAQGLDRVLLVPSARPPHKTSVELASPDDRLEMVRLAVKGREGLAASGLEVTRPGTSFTVDTLEQLRREYPDAELYFIIGADSIPELPGWKNSRRILELARVVAVNRPGHEERPSPDDLPGILRVTMPPCPQESRKIRDSIRRGEPVSSDVPPLVAAYIERRGLYRAG